MARNTKDENNDFNPQEVAAHVVNKVRGGGWKAAALIAGGMAAYGSYFTVDATERANVRRFGTPTHTDTLGSGLHFKIPFIDSADKLQVSLRTMHLDKFDVLTVDNQKVTLDINFNFTVPLNKVNHLLYEVGQSGSHGIDDQVAPVVKDRAGRIFATQNMVSVNSERAAIQAKLQDEVSKAVKELFGIEPHSLQIAGITPSKTFLDSNEKAVTAKNEAVAAENSLKTRGFEAQQTVIRAKADADSAIEAARGRSQAAILEAEAEKKKLELVGVGFETQIKAFGGPTLYIEHERAQAALQTAQRWNGVKSSVEVNGSGSSVSTVIPIAPVPMTGASGAASPAPR